ncbi:cornichon protein [Ostertagia ostertagi]
MRMLAPDLLNRATVATKTGSSGMAFTFAAFAYLIALIAVAFCIFFAIYTVICIDELKTDYKNPIEQCRNLNQLILPEYAIHIIYTCLFILSWQMFGILMNLPLAFYKPLSAAVIFILYMRRPVMSGPGIYDPTTILHSSHLSAALRASWAKLAFYLLSFFYYLYALIYTLVTSSS